MLHSFYREQQECARFLFSNNLGLLCSRRSSSGWPEKELRICQVSLLLCKPRKHKVPRRDTLARNKWLMPTTFVKPGALLGSRVVIVFPPCPAPGLQCWVLQPSPLTLHFSTRATTPEGDIKNTILIWMVSWTKSLTAVKKSPNHGISQVLGLYLHLLSVNHHPSTPGVQSIHLISINSSPTL